MNRVFWSLIFLLVPVLGVATFLVAPYYNIWLPIDVSVHGHTIDSLFMFILWLTGIAFIATELVLAWCVWKYGSKRAGPGPVQFTHGNHTLEICWTILPAAILLFIALYQMDAWADAKMSPPDIPPTVEVMARQFEWRFRYPGPDGELHTPDDIHTVNDLHLPVDEEILLHIKSRDVLHSFFLPNLRLKQDVIPGMLQKMWFQAKEVGQYDIACAELCGWGHYKMKGQVTFLPQAEYDAWLKTKYEEQMATHLPSSADDGE